MNKIKRILESSGYNMIKVNTKNSASDIDNIFIKPGKVNKVTYATTKASYETFTF